MSAQQRTQVSPHSWWQFVDQDPASPATGTFRASHTESIGRLYFPLVNEAGALSWVSPHLHGGLAASHHEYLSHPLTVEDLPHTLVHRDFWFVEPGRKPFALSGLTPDGLLAHLDGKNASDASQIEAGPGWFRIIRQDATRRFTVRATLWCPTDLNEKLECLRVEVTNTYSRTLRFRPYAAILLFARSADNLRDHRHVTALLNRIAIRRHGVVVYPTMSFDERGHKINATRYAVLAVGPHGTPPQGIWGVEEQFLGEGGNFAAPAAVWRQEQAPYTTRAELAGREAIGGFRFADLTLRPGRSAQYVLVSGISTDARAIGRWTQWVLQPGAAQQSLSRTRQAWLRQVRRISFSTADRTLDHWLIWVNCQPLLRRLYGNSYLPQFDYGRGGRGWRDLWQDCLALLLSDPASVRPTLLHNFGGVRIDGSNATIIGKHGEFIADRNNIPRTWMDHGAWPTYTTLLYVNQTGDWNFLLQQREYFRDAQLFRCTRRDPNWSEADSVTLRRRRGAVYRGSLFEHLLVQNLTAFFNVGKHNVCRLEGADWNDGLDMASQRGESVAFSAFYAWNLKRLAHFAELLTARGVTTITVASELGILLDRLPGQRRANYRSVAAKHACLTRYLKAVSPHLSGRMMRVQLSDLVRDLMAKYDDLAKRIQTKEWVRAKRHAFFNGYYDNCGRRVEGAHPTGVRMTLTGQVFAVMSGIANNEQVRHVIRSVNSLLRDPAHGGVRLNTDFGGMRPDLGRAFSFAYGEKENGAVFSHMAVMYAYALYLRRRPEEGRAVWRALYRMATNQPVGRIFPCLPEYFNAEGRGMYCYLTGSASWLIHLLLTQVYGIRGESGDLVIDPQLTREDFGSRIELSVTTTFAGRILSVTFHNPRRLSANRSVVESLQHEQAAVPFVRRGAEGICVSRRILERLPTRQPIHFRVTLGPG